MSDNKQTNNKSEGRADSSRRWPQLADSRLWQLEMWRSFALKDAVDEYAVLAVADHVEVVLVVVDLNMSARYERGVTHVDVHFAAAAVAADDNAVLSDHVLELASLEPRDRRRLHVRRVLNARRTGRRRLEGQQSPGVAVRRSAHV